MDSNTLQSYRHQQHQNHQPSSGLLRFRSALSYPFTNFAEIGVDKGNSVEGFETEMLISRFINSSSGGGGGGVSDCVSPSFDEFEDKSISLREYKSGFPPHYPKRSSTTGPMDGSFGLIKSMAMDQQPKIDSSDLMRQNSSPAGVFSNWSLHNGYGATRGMSNSGNGTNGELSRLKSQLSFPSRLSREDHGDNSSDDGKHGNAQFHFGAWTDSQSYAVNFSGLERDKDDEGKLYSGVQNGGRGNHLLSHHLSLPKTAAEIVAVEKFLQFQDSVPCKIRAKRGCATHPRSVAERVRRTRISERMRKLQELVPNMEKQTNTADMLDLAVDYIKDLQKQFKVLGENRANCKCLGMQKPVPTPH